MESLVRFFQTLKRFRWKFFIRKSMKSGHRSYELLKHFFRLSAASILVNIFIQPVCNLFYFTIVFILLSDMKLKKKFFPESWSSRIFRKDGMKKCRNISAWSVNLTSLLESAVVNGCSLSEKYYDRDKNVPVDFYEEYSVLTAKAGDIWQRAKRADDYKQFEPYPYPALVSVNPILSEPLPFHNLWPFCNTVKILHILTSLRCGYK